MTAPSRSSSSGAETYHARASGSAGTAAAGGGAAGGGAAGGGAAGGGAAAAGGGAASGGASSPGCIEVCGRDFDRFNTPVFLALGCMQPFIVQNKVTLQTLNYGVDVKMPLALSPRARTRPPRRALQPRGALQPRRGAVPRMSASHGQATLYERLATERGCTRFEGTHSRAGQCTVSI